MINKQQMIHNCFSPTKGKLPSPKASFSSNPRQSHPIHIITTSFHSISFLELQERLQRQSLLFLFQKQTHSLTRASNHHTSKYFIVLVGFSSALPLTGQFDYLSCQILQYPNQCSLDQIMLQYYQFMASIKNSYFQSCDIFSSKMHSNQQKDKEKGILDTPSKITIKSVEKNKVNYKSDFKKVLFIYCTQYDDNFYRDSVSFMKENIESCDVGEQFFINSVEEYVGYIGEKSENVKFYLLMSEYSLLNFKALFRKIDEILVVTPHYEKAIALLKGKVTHIVNDRHSLLSILHKHFHITINSIHSSSLHLHQSELQSQPINQTSLSPLKKDVFQSIANQPSLYTSSDLQSACSQKTIYSSKNSRLIKRSQGSHMNKSKENQMA